MNWPALVAHLETIGRHDADGVKLRAKSEHCTCGVRTLVGLDADPTGLVRRVDIVDLDRAAEARVLLTGGKTMTVLELPDGIRIVRRHAEAIRAERQERPVVSEHRCWVIPPVSKAWRWRLPHSQILGDAPPF